MDSAEKNSAFDKRLKRQVIGKPHRFLAVVPLGFEKTFVREMDFLRRESVENQGTNSLDIKIAGDGKVEFTAKLVDAWKVVAYSRIANRIQMHIADFKAENFRELEKKAAVIPWELFLTTNHQPLTTIHVTCKHSRLYHSDAVAERLQKVIEGGSLRSESEDVIVDDHYINNLLAADEIKRRNFKNALERVNEKLAECETR